MQPAKSFVMDWENVVYGVLFPRQLTQNIAHDVHARHQRPVFFRQPKWGSRSNARRAQFIGALYFQRVSFHPLFRVFALSIRVGCVSRPSKFLLPFSIEMVKSAPASPLTIRVRRISSFVFLAIAIAAKIRAPKRACPILQKF
jgi:hypothetical protein